MPDVYYDSRLAQRVTDHSLDENTDYYVDVTGLREEEVSNLFSLSGMSGMYDWIPGSPAAKIRFTNYIGKCNIGSQRLEIRSKKFLPEFTGAKQLEMLLREIEQNIGRSYLDVDSPSITARAVDWSTPTAALLHEFNYFYHAFFSVSQDKRVPWLFQRVAANPQLDHSAIRKQDLIWTVKRVGNDFARSLTSVPGEAVGIENCSGLADSLFRAAHPEGTFDSMPLRISHTQHCPQANTPENRFVKYLFEYIGVVCRRAEAAFSDSQLIVQRAKRLGPNVQRILADAFFGDVGQLTQIPTSSNVLRYRHGYKELYEHYVKAHMGIIPKFLDAVEGQVSEIKNVAVLYEIWCYSQVAKQVLGEDCEMRKSDIHADGSSLLYEAELCNGRFRVSYNRSFTPSNAGSYSLILRPDIVVEDVKAEKIVVFDAKYRSVVELDEDRNVVSSKYQSSDVHKMHTYVDAITDCRASIALYVGESFRLFKRGEFKGGQQDSGDMVRFEGVGVVPLVPGRENREFKALIDRLVDAR